jgi:hypothetical protein
VDLIGVASGRLLGTLSMQFPIPRQEFVDPVSRVLGDAGEDIGQPSLRIDIVHFGRLCRAPNYAEVARFPQDSS